MLFTHADPCVKFIEDRIREEKKTPRTSTNTEVCDHEALLCDLSGHHGHTRADYIREMMSLGFSFAESVKKYGTCPAVIQRKQQREAKKAASLAKKAEAPPRKARRKKAPSKVPPQGDEKPQEVDSDNDSDMGASERF